VHRSIFRVARGIHPLIRPYRCFIASPLHARVKPAHDVVAADAIARNDTLSRDKKSQSARVADLVERSSLD
jgi:hypothetical protein